MEITDIENEKEDESRELIEELEEAQKIEAQEEDKEKEKRRLFDKYVMPNYDIIKRLVEKYTQYRQNADADLNTVLLELYRYIITYDETRSLKSWLYTVVRHTVQKENENRSKLYARYHGSALEDIMMSGFDVRETDKKEHIGEKPIEEQVGDEMREALMRLPAEHRRVLALRSEGFSVTEIVEIKFKEGSLKTNDHKAKKKSRICCWRRKRKSRNFLAKKFQWTMGFADPPHARQSKQAPFALA